MTTMTTQNSAKQQHITSSEFSLHHLTICLLSSRIVRNSSQKNPQFKFMSQDFRSPKHPHPDSEVKLESNSKRFTFLILTVPTFPEDWAAQLELSQKPERLCVVQVFRQYSDCVVKRAGRPVAARKQRRSWAVTMQLKATRRVGTS